MFILIILILIIFSLALIDVITMYNVGGINWDFIAKVLYAKSILNPTFYSALFNGSLSNVITYGNTFYFESLRAPIMGILIIPFLVLIGNSFVPFYLASGLILLLFSVIYISKIMNINPLLLTLLFLTLYVVIFFSLLNGAEILSMSFILISIGLVINKRWKSGIMIAIVGLTKYPSLIFIPRLLILPKKIRKKEFTAFVLTTVPWLVFNTVVWHNPLFSYLLSIGTFSSAKTGIFNVSIIITSLKMILSNLIPAFLLIIALLLLKVAKDKKHIDIHKLIYNLHNIRYRHKVIILVIILSILGFVLTSIDGSMNATPRLGYLIYIGIALSFGILITKLSSNYKTLLNRNILSYIIAVLFIIIFAMLIHTFNHMHTNYYFGQYGSTNHIYYTVKTAFVEHNIVNCRVISNNWVYLIYFGIKAHYPYLYNSTNQHYPIIYFSNIGTHDGAGNFNNVTKRFNYNGFYIAFPKNWTCIQ